MTKPSINKSFQSKTLLPSKLINMELLYSLYFNKDIHGCFEKYSNINKINNLITKFAAENKVGLASLRTIFKDFNPTFQSEQMALLGTSKPMIPQDTSNICNDKGTRKRDYQNNWTNMCFYCGTPILKGQDKQCDHVIDILNTYVSVKPNEYFYRNFQYVHRICNSKASNNDLTWIWNSVGKPEFFPPPLSSYTEKNFCVSNFLESSNVLNYNNFFQYNSAICRYYLFENILKYLESWSEPVFIERKTSIRKIYREYQSFLDNAKINLNISSDINAANILIKMPSNLTIKKTIKKRTPTRNKSQKKRIYSNRQSFKSNSN